MTYTEPLTYATLERVETMFESGQVTPAVKLRISDALVSVTGEIKAECGGRDYFPHATPTTWLADGDGSPLLHVHQGVIELTLIEISFDLGRTFVALDPSDWTLQWDGFSSEPVPSGEPYFHVRIRPLGAYLAFPRGMATVRLTGVRGWPAIPPALVEGCAERARQIVYADPTYMGSIPGPANGGGPVMERWPQVLWRFLDSERSRFMACYA